MTVTQSSTSLLERPDASVERESSTEYHALKAPPKRSLPRLTSWRYFAATLVVLTHVGFQFTSSRVLRKAETYGFDAVTFFFIISGFVLVWSYKTQSAGGFFWKRFTKVWPIQFAVALLVLWTLGPLERVPGSISGRLVDLIGLQAWWPNSQVYFGINGVDWSLSCEIFFYAIFPILVARLIRFDARKTWTALGVVTVLLVTTPIVVAWTGVMPTTYRWLFFVFPPYQLGFFVVGMLLGYVMRQGYWRPTTRGLTPLAMLWLVGLTAYGAWYDLINGHDLSRPLVMLAATPAFLGIIAAAVKRDCDGSSSWMTSKVMVLLGTTSFELYLIHKPIFILTDHLGVWAHSGAVEGVLLFVVFLGLTSLSSILIHTAVSGRLERFVRERCVLSRLTMRESA
jgi:peptidoglycan/LPS O-acetylase OafA/YrhL